LHRRGGYFITSELPLSANQAHRWLLSRS
jgi:hypothetical protein